MEGRAPWDKKNVNLTNFYEVLPPGQQGEGRLVPGAAE